MEPPIRTMSSISLALLSLRTEARILMVFWKRSSLSSSNLRRVRIEVKGIPSLKDLTEIETEFVLGSERSHLASSTAERSFEREVVSMSFLILWLGWARFQRETR